MIVKIESLLSNSKTFIIKVLGKILITYWHVFNKQLWGREFLPLLINSLKLTGTGVEVGTADGKFSNTILRYSNLSLLYSIDLWEYIDQNIYQDAINDSQEGHNNRFLTAVNQLKKYESRSAIIKTSSEKAAQIFTNNVLDFVFIDANHCYQYCKQDLELWWPKIRKGGVLAGHDYVNGTFNKTAFGVKQAVDEFFLNKNQKINITQEKWPSWYVIKN